MDKQDELLARITTGHKAALDGFFRDCAELIKQVSSEAADTIAAGGKLMFCGNGGSACDSMHIAGEFVGRFIKNRDALAAVALTADSGILTCIANDYSYEDIFSRQVEALGREGDMLIALSTSGSSPNVLKAIKTAKARGIKTALFTGDKARNNEKIADFTLIVPSVTTAHIQESHMVALHGMAGLIELKIFPNL